MGKDGKGPKKSMKNGQGIKKKHVDPSKKSRVSHKLEVKQLSIELKDQNMRN